MVGFFIVVVFVYGLVKKKKWYYLIGYFCVILWLLFGIGLFIWIVLILWVGFYMDVFFFKNWVLVVVNYFLNFYVKSGSDYLLFYIYILFIVGKVGSLLDF